jgi:hypothetical protein
MESFNKWFFSKKYQIVEEEEKVEDKEKESKKKPRKPQKYVNRRVARICR